MHSKTGQYIFGGALVGVAVLHLALGANDPLSSLWTAIASSIEIVILAAGLFLVWQASRGKLV